MKVSHLQAVQVPRSGTARFPKLTLASRDQQSRNLQSSMDLDLMRLHGFLFVDGGDYSFSITF